MSSTRYEVGSFCKVALTLLFAATLSGCVVSFSNPLPASQPIGSDERLIGKWEGQDEQGNNIWARFESGSNHEIKVSLSGSLGYRNPVFRMVTTKISGNDYMILRLNDPYDNRDYMVGRYSTNDDKLTVCLLNVQKVKEAIKKGKLKGEVDLSPWGGATITESSKNVVTFLGSRNSKDLFTCLGELKKVPAK